METMLQGQSNYPEAEKLFNPDNPPSFHDPFAGGGAIPIEAQD